ncbi:MAG: hypothetical protein V2A61_08485 [Calditrichota bacterium]
MSILILSAELDEELLQVGDEIGVFTPGGVCAGASVIPRAGFPVGLSAWACDESHPDYDENVDYFIAEEALSFRFWDQAEGREIDAEISEVFDGETVFIDGSLVTLSLEAYRYPDQPVALAFPEEVDFGEVRRTRTGEAVVSVRNGGRQPLVVTQARCEGDYFGVNFPGEIALQLRRLMTSRFPFHRNGLATSTAA